MINQSKPTIPQNRKMSVVCTVVLLYGKHHTTFYQIFPISKNGEKRYTNFGYAKGLKFEK